MEDEYEVQKTRPLPHQCQTLPNVSRYHFFHYFNFFGEGAEVGEIGEVGSRQSTQGRLFR